MRLKLGIVVGLILTLSLWSNSISAQDATDEASSKKKQEIEELQQKLNDVKGQKQTLSSTIQVLNSRMALAQAKIEQNQVQLLRLESEIAALDKQIDNLNNSLSNITEVLLNRVQQSYKRSQFSPMFALFASHDLSQSLTRYKYLQLTARNDREVMYQMESTKHDFQNQKELKEAKQQELDETKASLESEQKNLNQQQREKAALLEITRNDEKRFQSELAQKLAELEAIQSIIAGNGSETEVRDVKQGDAIAQVIPGPSTCSSGAHLHLEVAEKKVHKNPASYLQDKSVVWDNGPDQPFSFSGSWSWPLNDTIRITQGYGMTFYAATMRYYGGSPHTGIDMVNPSDYTVKAVAEGKLYRGAIACAGRTLRYVRVAHKDSDLSTYYLHVNY